jgi:hypothetical protein
MSKEQEEYIRLQLESAKNCEMTARDSGQSWYWRGWQDALKMVTEMIDNQQVIAHQTTEQPTNN